MVTATDIGRVQTLTELISRLERALAELEHTESPSDSADPLVLKARFALAAARAALAGATA